MTVEENLKYQTLGVNMTTRPNIPIAVTLCMDAKLNKFADNYRPFIRMQHPEAIARSVQIYEINRTGAGNVSPLRGDLQVKAETGAIIGIEGNSHSLCGMHGYVERIGPDTQRDDWHWKLVKPHLKYPSDSIASSSMDINYRTIRGFVDWANSPLGHTVWRQLDTERIHPGPVVGDKYLAMSEPLRSDRMKFEHLTDLGGTPYGSTYFLTPPSERALDRMANDLRVAQTFNMQGIVVFQNRNSDFKMAPHLSEMLRSEKISMKVLAVMQYD